MKQFFVDALSLFVQIRHRFGKRGFKATSRIKCAAAAMLIFSGCAVIYGQTQFPDRVRFLDPSGILDTYVTGGKLDVTGPFFQSLGTNGRSCASCHQASDAWSVTPPHIQARFMVSQGLDPIFRPVDGANCPSADVSTPRARQRSYSMLLNKGLIRVSIGVPDKADFSVAAINDPHNCPETTSAGLALFRRPLPSANLPFLTTVMWDGRESFKGQSLNFNLSDQAVQATLGHAQGAQAPTPDQVAAIVNFELANFAAQSFDNSAGDLDAHGAAGGPENLSQQPFFVGINDPLGADPTQFNPVAMSMFDAWANLKSREDSGYDDERNEARASIARGEALFNTLPITITGVTGLNDLPGLSSFVGSCTTCHNTPNVGNHSVPLAINIGITDYPALPALNTEGLPVYTIQCAAGALKPLNKGTTFQTTDPGRALITGKCADVGKTKGPILRGLAARAPYFHNGSATTLDNVLEFYKQRFNLNLSNQQKRDLVAFLQSL